ncbi:MAG: hypothetical protein JWM19_6965 [Actinomycetia bacterium]|nr:hypothetical protein [Actinomycetes bacterium]
MPARVSAAGRPIAPCGKGVPVNRAAQAEVEFHLPGRPLPDDVTGKLLRVNAARVLGLG